jgi:hypothetical protein
MGELKRTRLEGRLRARWISLEFIYDLAMARRKIDRGRVIR